MMREIKSYFLFISPLYRILLYLVVPLVALVLHVLLSVAYGITDENAFRVLGEVTSVYYIIILMIYEVIIDNKIFGGSLCRGESRLEYLKTSGRGMDLYRDVLAGDQRMRFIFHLYGTGICVLVSGIILRKEVSVLVTEWVTMLAISYALAQAGVLVVRRVRTESVGIFVAAVLSFVSGILVTGLRFVIAEESDYTQIMLTASIIGLVIGGFLSRLMVTRGMKRKEEEYYDQ